MGIQVTVHLVVFAIRDSRLKVLLTRPRGTVRKHRAGVLGIRLSGRESFEDAAKRGLLNQVGANHVPLEQLHCSVDPKESGGRRALSVAYYALLPPGRTPGAKEAVWCSVRDLQRLTPVQRRIVDQALKRLRRKFEHNTAALNLLGKKFTLPELQGIYETILDKKLDKRNFRKKIDSLRVLKPLAEWRRTGRKPARLYSVVAHRLEKLESREVSSQL